MTMTQDRLVCIDDNDANLRLIEKSLRDDYDVVRITDPLHALATIEEVQPALVLLDVNMPGLNGYDLCRQLRANPATAELPVVFLSCMKDLVDRLAGYDAGGDGYITKPFDLRELQSVVRAHILRKRQIDDSKRNAEQLRAMSWTMLRNNSEMGELLRFSQGIAKMKDEAALVDSLFTTLTHLGLSATVLLKIISGEVVARSDGKPFTLIEKELLDLACNGERITANGNKYLFRGDNIILLIRNMPLDDEALLGRLRDHLCILLDSAEASITIINGEKLREQLQKNQTDQTLHGIQQEFRNMVATADQLHQRSSSSIEGLARALEHAFMVMDLTEEQEHKLLQFIEQARAELEHQQDLKQLFQASMHNILELVGGKGHAPR